MYGLLSNFGITYTDVPKSERLKRWSVRRIWQCTWILQRELGQIAPNVLAHMRAVRLALAEEEREASQLRYVATDAIL